MFAAIKWWPFYLLLFLGLGGCTANYNTSLLTLTSETERPAEAETVKPLADCPTPTAETQLFQHHAAGYCLLYPQGYEVQQPNEDTTIILASAPADTAQTSVVIEVQDAVERSVAQFADVVTTDVYTALPDWEIERTEGLTVDGDVAIMLDPMPGRTLNRQLLTVHGNRSYRLIFLPADPEQVGAYAQMEVLYTTVVNSFTFAKAQAAVSSATATCPTPTADAQLLRHDVQGYCLLYPTGYEVVEQAVDYAITVMAPPSTLGHRERLFINIEEAKGRSAEEAAMELLATYTLPAGTDITTVEFLPNRQPVYVLDPLPGQDLSRHAFFVQDERLFHLLFVPSDPDQDEAYQQMELLYTTVLASFTFIPPSQDAAAPGLVWEGYTPWGDGDDSYCKSLHLFRNDQALIGPCDAPDTAVQINREQEWAEMLNLFAPFEVESADGQLIFYGSGERNGEAWQRAIDAWARYTYAELATGSVTASGRTVLSWWLGELSDQPDTCGHLLVLVHGFAQISIEPCGGGEALARAQSWLQTDEWERFDAWLYNRAPVAQEADYFTGLGTEEMSTTERAALAQWAEAVYDRIANATPSYLGQDAIETDQFIGRIVFASRQSGDMDIYIMQPDGSNPLRLSQDETWDGFPTPSSDGQRVAFVAETLDSQRTPLKSDIFVVNSDGSGLTNLTDHSAFDTQPSWSPDGTLLAFVSTRNGDGYTPSLYRMEADGSQLHLLVENAEQPAWSPTGEQIAFVQDGQIHLLQLADQTTVQLTTDTAPSPQAAANSNPLWSPDGSQIVFTSNRDGNGEIYVMNADGSAQINLSRLPGYQNSPVWSPDGSQIAFASDDSDQPGVYIIHADGSDLVKVTRAVTPEFLPTWSPDGRWLAFVSDPAEQVIARANMDEVQQGDGVFPHLLTPAQNTFPVWIR